MCLWGLLKIYASYAYISFFPFSLSLYLFPFSRSLSLSLFPFSRSIFLSLPALTPLFALWWRRRLCQMLTFLVDINEMQPGLGDRQEADAFWTARYGGLESCLNQSHSLSVHLEDERERRPSLFLFLLIFFTFAMAACVCVCAVKLIEVGHLVSN